MDKSNSTINDDPKDEGQWLSVPVSLPTGQTTVSTLAVEERADQIAAPYRLYKRRFIGAIGVFMLDLLGGLNPSWFGPISNNASQYLGQSLDELNWLGNVIFLCYMAFAPLAPITCRRFGVVATCYIGVIPIVLGVWLRYAGASPSLSGGSGYALIMFSQILLGFSQPIFQIVAVRYSEAWFDLRSRTTATLVMSLGNPVGSAIGQLVSPTGSVRESLLISAIISTALTPFLLIVRPEPPTPPTYSGSLPSPSITTFLRALFGVLPRQNADGKEDVSYMTLRERLDFIIIMCIFGTFVAAITSFNLLNDQIFQPYGYSSATAGHISAATLLSGLGVSLVTAPIFDRIFTNHLAIAIRIFVPIVAVGWFSLIWAVRENNIGALYVVMIVIGVFSISLLPIGLELGVEVTRNANVSSAVLWGSSHLVGLIFVLAASALRDGPDAYPPLNMHRSLIFLGTWCLVFGVIIFAIRGNQARRERDILMAKGS